MLIKHILKNLKILKKIKSWSRGYTTSLQNKKRKLMSFQGAALNMLKGIEAHCSDWLTAWTEYFTVVVLYQLLSIDIIELLIVYLFVNSVP